MKLIVKNMRFVVFNCFLIVSGCLIYAVGINSVLIPNHLLSGGAVGIVIILHYLLPAFGMGFYYFLLNIPLFFIGWYTLSWRFMAYTLFGIISFSLASSWITPPAIPTKDPIMAALLAGVICGTGGGLILRSVGSTGGLDIIAIVLNQRWGIRLGIVYTFFNTAVLIAGAFIFDIERSLYSVIYVYASSRVLDSVASGFNKRKLLFIISPKWEEIANFILHQINRGVTLLKATGGYTGGDRPVILTVTTITELPRLKEEILKIDPEAFIIINETLEVLGKRHGKKKIY